MKDALALAKTKKQSAKGRLIVGWREWVGLPELGILAVKAKIDTGARTSALHASKIELFEKRGRRYVRFCVHPLQRRADPTMIAEAPLVESRRIRSSHGHLTIRPVIMAVLSLGPLCWPIELTLVDRDLMGFRMLIGRHAIRKKFLVDPAKSFVLGPTLK